jgi:hypothetical protein
MLMPHRKDKPVVNHFFGQVFSWGEAIDAVADIYNGVSFPLRYAITLLTCSSLFSGRH